MAEVPLREVEPAEGPPRLELAEWRSRWGIVAGISTRGPADTPCDMGLAGDAPVGVVLARWHRLLAACSPARSLVAARQVHGSEVRWHGAGQGSGLHLIEGVDGHATGVPDLLLGVTVADCIPVYLADPVRRLIALLHAGWRGTAGGILAAGVRLLVDRGARPEDLVMHAGVGICGPCYEVGPEVLSVFGRAPAPSGRGHLDLRSVLAGQARAAGVGEVTVSPWCAAHDRTRFFSHRASRGGDGGRMVAYLGLLS
jgi:hypothetical protein